MNMSPTQLHDAHEYQFGLATQVRLLTHYLALRDRATQRVERARDDDRGEVTATTALIVLLVAAAVVAGTVIATKIKANANNIEDPG